MLDGNSPRLPWKPSITHADIQALWHYSRFGFQPRRTPTILIPLGWRHQRRTTATSGSDLRLTIAGPKGPWVADMTHVTFGSYSPVINAPPARFCTRSPPSP